MKESAAYSNWWKSLHSCTYANKDKSLQRNSTQRCLCWQCCPCCTQCGRSSAPSWPVLKCMQWLQPQRQLEEDKSYGSKATCPHHQGLHPRYHPTVYLSQTMPLLVWKLEKELERLQTTWPSFCLKCGRRRYTTQTQIALYCACIVSSLLCGHDRQEKQLHIFNMRCLCRILSISWENKVSNSKVLERAGILSIYTLLRHRRLRWLGHVHCMDDDRIPKDLLYGELELNSRPVDQPKWHFKDVCNRNIYYLQLGNLSLWIKANGGLCPNRHSKLRMYFYGSEYFYKRNILFTPWRFLKTFCGAISG